MTSRKKDVKFKLIREHREFWYERTLDKLIDGKATPRQVTERYNKLKEVKK